MNKLLRFWNRGPHLSAEDASALADGALSPGKAAAAEAHVAACDACRAQVAEIGAVRAMLSTLPEAEAPRSFRLLPMDVEQPAAAPATGGGPGIGERLMPVMSATAAAVFVIAMALQFYPSGDDDSDGGGALNAMSAGRVDGQRAEDAAGAGEEGVDGSPATRNAPAAGSIAPEMQQTPQAAEAIVPDAQTGGASADGDAAPPAPDAPAGQFESERAGSGPQSDPPEAAADAAKRAGDDDGGVSTLRLIAIVSAGVAVVAGAGAIGMRRSRRGA